MTPHSNDPIYQAQDILSRRDHSEFEVRTKLKRKRFSLSEIDTAISWLYEKKLLDDYAFAERYIESALRAKPVGPRWLSAKLRQKGIQVDIIEKILTNLLSPEKEQQLAADAARRWQQNNSTKADDKQRLTRFLQSRGFSFEAIAGCIEKQND